MMCTAEKANFNPSTGASPPWLRETDSIKANKELAMTLQKINSGA